MRSNRPAFKQACVVISEISCAIKTIGAGYWEAALVAAANPRIGHFS
jgi:hypothetical protein